MLVADEIEAGLAGAISELEHNTNSCRSPASSAGNTLIAANVAFAEAKRQPVPRGER
jgi:hypothetical protein